VSATLSRNPSGRARRRIIRVRDGKVEKDEATR